MKMGTRLFRKIVYVVTIVAISAFAAWTGSNLEPSSTKTIDGKKFYEISTPDELAWFAKEVNNGNTQINAILKNDIVFGKDTASICSYSWTPIGHSPSNEFNGIFDGNNKSIYGLLISDQRRYVGFMGVVGLSGVVRNLKIMNVEMLGKLNNSFSDSLYYVGSLAAYNQGKITNVSNMGNLSTIRTLELPYGVKVNYVGGLVGFNMGHISWSINYGTIVGGLHLNYDITEYHISANNYAGGITGGNDGAMENVINYGNVSSSAHSEINRYYGSSNSYAYVGGISAMGNGQVINSISQGMLKISSGALGLRTIRKGFIRIIAPLSKNSYSITDSIIDYMDATVYGPSLDSYYDADLLPDYKLSNAKSTAEMQKDQFAWVLNTTNGTEKNSGVWSRYDGYPVFANDTLRSIHRVVFNDGENTTAYYTNYKGLVPEFPEIPRAPEGKAFAGWVNSSDEDVNLTTVFLKDQTITAKFLDWEDVVYSIRFLDEKGNVLDLQSVHSGETPLFGGTIPTKNASIAYTYAFKGWSPEIAPAVWHTDYTVMFDSTINQYKVSYVDYDGTELFSSMFDYGTKPTYSTIPKKINTVAYLYSFAGWSPAVENVSGEAVYKAVYDSVLQKYSIEFKANGETLLSKDYDYGSVPKYEDATPTKPATKAYSYSFAGWEPEIAKVTEATSYTAKFDSSLNKYMVVFQNGAKVLQDSEIEYGKVPVYEGETPKKTSTAKYDYSFSSWSPALTKVTDEATYTALFDSTLRSYEVSFVSEGETLLAKEYEYGTLPKFEGNEPSKKESKGFTYSFKGWNPSVAMVKDKAVYTAVFDSVAKTFVVTFMNGKDTLQSTAVSYGNTPEYKGKTPTKSGSDKYEFKFSGWSPKLATVTEEAVYKAVFDSTKLTGILVSRLVNSNLLIKVNSRNIQISAAPVGKAYALLDMQGRVLQKGRVDSANFSIVAPRAGSFFIRIGSQIRIVRIK